MEEGIGQSIIYNKNASTRLDELIVCLSGCQNVRTRAFHIAFYAFTKRPAPSYSGGQGIGPRRSFVVPRRRRIIIIIMRNSCSSLTIFGFNGVSEITFLTFFLFRVFTSYYVIGICILFNHHSHARQYLLSFICSYFTEMF